MMLFVAGVTQLKANDTIVNVTQIFGWIDICFNKYDRVLAYAPDGCTDFSWDINGQAGSENPAVIDGNLGDIFHCYFFGCDIGVNNVTFVFNQPNVPTETTRVLWKHQGYSLPLEAIGADSLDMYDFHWNTGETTPTIEVTEPGIYTCGISDQCATATRTFIVRDNVEIYRATVDLATSLNKVTWQTTPEQAEYISEVKVERDGMVVGTVPYTDGQFIDNIGSENAARNYRLTGIDMDGNECPILSYQKGTLHVDYSPNASNPNKLNMAWTPPFIEEGASISVTYFQICKYDPNTGEVTVIDQIGANNTIGSYDVNLFDGGYATVAALFSEGKDYEDLAFSNLTEDVLAVGENAVGFNIYPNPSKDRVTIEGTGTLTVTNTLGQTILTKEIDGKTNIELPQGLYFVKLCGTTRKIVVE